MFMAVYGRQGLPELARINLDRAHFAQGALTRAAAAAGVRPRFSGPFFNEFVVGGIADAGRLHARLVDEGLIAGIALGRFYPELADSLLISVTELHSADDIERLARQVARRAGGDYQ